MKKRLGGARNLVRSVISRSLRILVVEDSEHTRDGLCLVLEVWTVDTAADGPDGLWLAHMVTMMPLPL